MVAHHPEVVGGHGDLEVELGGLVSREDIGLVKVVPVDVNLAVAPFDCVATDADDPLDEVALTCGGGKA